MPDDQQPNASEQLVTEEHGEVVEDQIRRATENARQHPEAAAVGEARQDPTQPQAGPSNEGATDPSGTGPGGLAGDMGISSGRTTPQHPRTNDARDVSPGPYDAPDVSTDGPAPESEDYADKTWGGTMRVGGEQRPAPIEDEKVRRDNIDPTPMP